ncbi:MAG: TetR/AcrR family transcriptional regulator [Pseudomonadota bacterium]
MALELSAGFPLSRLDAKRRIFTMPYNPGSPPDRIVKAGRTLFFELGFERVSTDMLAKEASVSKATLYKYFPNMVKVLEAVTYVEAESFEAGTAMDVETFGELCDALTQYGANLMRFLNKPEIIQFSQLMYEEARAHPDIASEFYNAAYGRALRRISALLQQGIDKGLIESALPASELADQLMGMWEGMPFVRALMCVSKRPFTRPQEWSAKCVSTLLAPKT